MMRSTRTVRLSPIIKGTVTLIHSECRVSLNYGHCPLDGRLGFDDEALPAPDFNLAPFDDLFFLDEHPTFRPSFIAHHWSRYWI